VKAQPLCLNSVCMKIPFPAHVPIHTWSRTGEGSSGGRKKGVVGGVGQERLGPSYFFIPLVLGPKQPRMVGTFFKVHTRPRLAYALRCRGY
jgi:hypothetical protein